MSGGNTSPFFLSPVEYYSYYTGQEAIPSCNFYLTVIINVVNISVMLLSFIFILSIFFLKFNVVSKKFCRIVLHLRNFFSKNSIIPYNCFVYVFLSVFALLRIEILSLYLTAVVKCMAVGFLFG